MPGKIELVRLPIDTHCADPDCKKALSFGSWAYYYEEDERAICLDCGAKRGWTSKDTANLLIKEVELREDIKKLKKQRKIELDAFILLRDKVNIHRLGEGDRDLENQIEKDLATVQDYLQRCGTPEEKEALLAIANAVRETQDLRREVRQQLETRLFMLERIEQKRKRKGLAPLEAIEHEE